MSLLLLLLLLPLRLLLQCFAVTENNLIEIGNFCIHHKSFNTAVAYVIAAAAAAANTDSMNHFLGMNIILVLIWNKFLIASHETVAALLLRQQLLILLQPAAAPMAAANLRTFILNMIQLYITVEI
jgi:hypothetical protein